MRVFHTGFEIIKDVDLDRGRKNADFGPGFYMSPDGEFSRRWARERRGASTFVNEYELDLEALDVKTLQRDEEWFDCIFSNRNDAIDRLSSFDVVIGPIANDTIYDLMGITTSGFLDRGQALSLLLEGPVYKQVVVKSRKALSHLRWICASKLSSEDIADYRSLVQAEEAAYQKIVADKVEGFLG